MNPRRFFRRLGALRVAAALGATSCAVVSVTTGLTGLLPSWLALAVAAGSAGCAAIALDDRGHDDAGSATTAALLLLCVPLLVGCGATWAVHGLSGGAEVSEDGSRVDTGAVICHGAVCLDVRTWYVETGGVVDVCVEVVGVQTWCRTVSGHRDESGRPVPDGETGDASAPHVHSPACGCTVEV